MKTAIISGGGSGIGRAIAGVLSESGFRVGLFSRRGAVVQAAAQAITAAGGEAWCSQVDVRDEAAVERFIAETVHHYDRIDLLINNAGVFGMHPVEETSTPFWHETIDINLRGAFTCARAAWPYLADGQIINISSVAGVEPFWGNAAYSAAKYGLIGLSEVLALEGRPRGIRVHVVAPGATRTAIWEDSAPPDDLARMMRPEDVAGVVRWLALSPPEITFDTIVVRPAMRP